MGKIKDMSGGRYGRLTVIKSVGRKHKEVVWRCKCDCGNEVDVLGGSLRSGRTKSCGCLTVEKTKAANTRHGLTGTRIFRVYYNMKNRCYNPNYYLFHRYGGRGITVCPEWLGENGLSAFWEWSKRNGYDDSKSIDRIDNDKGYSPSNCRWATMKEQQNNRSNNRIITVNGRSETMAKWTEIINKNYSCLQRHVKKGTGEQYILEQLNGCF